MKQRICIDNLSIISLLSFLLEDKMVVFKIGKLNKEVKTIAQP